MANKKLYWAYGSNLNVDRMTWRCPQARKYEPLVLNDSRLIFRGVADVEHNEGTSVPGGLWWITAECEKELDSFEGVRSKLYEKTYITIDDRGTVHDVLVYRMTKTGIMPPSEYYLDIIRKGYKDFKLDVTVLDAAVNYAKENKELTPYLEKRRTADSWQLSKKQRRSLRREFRGNQLTQQEKTELWKEVMEDNRWTKNNKQNWTKNNKRLPPPVWNGGGSPSPLFQGHPNYWSWASNGFKPPNDDTETRVGWPDHDLE